MEMAISERFPALSPLKMRREKASEVFLFIRRLNEYNSRQNKKGGKKVIKRPAGDDWF